MSIYVCFESHMICLHNDYKALSKVYPTKAGHGYGSGVDFHIQTQRLTHGF